MAKQRFSLGLAIGALAGLVMGLLTAPKSGKETREDIKRKAGEVKDETVRKAKDAKDKANQFVGSTRKKVDEAVDDAKDKAGELKKRAEGAVDSAKSDLNKRAK